MITVVTIASRIVGFGRWIAQSVCLGTHGIDVPFNQANQLPNILFEVAAGGALAGSVIPLLSGPIARRHRDQVSQIASALLGWTLVVLVPLAILVAVFAHPIALVLKLKPGIQADIGTEFLQVFAIQIPLYGIAVVLGAVLQAHKKFFWQAFAPLVSSLVVIVVYVVFGAMADGHQKELELLTQQSLMWLAWGTTAGVAALAIPLIWPVHRLKVRIRPTLRFPNGEGRRATHLAFAGIAALIAQQACTFLTLQSATKFGEANTVYLYVQQVYLLPYAVLAYPLATSTFPRLAEHVAQGRVGAFRALTSRTTRALLVVIAAGVAALYAASGPVQAAFTWFANGSVAGMASALAAMAPGLVGYALILHLSRALYVVDRQRVAMVATALGWVVAGTGAYVLPRLLAHPRQESVLTVLGWSMTAGMTVAGVLLLIAVGRYAGREAVRGIPRTLLVLVLAVVIGGGAGSFIARSLASHDSGLLIALGVGTLAAVVAVALTLGVSILLDRSALLGFFGRSGGPTDGSDSSAEEVTSQTPADGEPAAQERSRGDLES